MTYQSFLTDKEGDLVHKLHKKPILFKRFEEQEKKQKTLEIAKLKQEIAAMKEEKKKNLESTSNEQLKENSQRLPQQIIIHPVSGQAPTKEKTGLLHLVGKLLTLIINLLIAIVENLQFLLMMIILTIAAIIIMKYTGIDVNTIIDKGGELLRK